MFAERDPADAEPARAGCWPSASEELLLQAALMPGAGGREAWRRWSATGDAFPQSFDRFLPLLWSNLRASEAADPRLARCRAAYERTRYANLLRLEDARLGLRALAAEGIETLVLKGPALLRYYGDPGLRPMADVDVLVRPRSAEQAVRVLAGLGWRSDLRVDAAAMARVHSTPVSQETGSILDLHWRALADGGSEQDHGLWGDSQTIPAGDGGDTFRVLAPTDQLFHVCARAARWDWDVPYRWVPDALAVIRHGRVDWDRLIAQAQSRRLGLPVREALAYLRTAFDAPVPGPVVERLERARSSLLERLTHRARGRHPDLRGPVLASALHWTEFRRLTAERAVSRGPLGLLATVQAAWGLKRRRHVPLAAVRKGLRRLRQLGRWHARHALGRWRAWPLGGKSRSVTTITFPLAPLV